MAKVHSSRAKIYEKKVALADEPTEHVESEGERLIKQLVLKQLDTQISLPEQLKQTKEFKKAQYLPLTNYTTGQVSLDEFQQCANRADYVEELKSSGLTDEEVELVLDHEKGEEFFTSKYKKLESSVLNSWLKHVLSKIHADQQIDDSKQCGSSSVSRHEKELGLAVKPDSEHTKLLKFALSCQQGSSSINNNINNDFRPPSHPIHQLKQLEHELFAHLKPKIPKSKKKPKKSLTAVSTPKFKSKNCTLSKIPPSTSCSSEKTSLWDLKDTCNIHTMFSGPPAKPDRVYTCKTETLYTIKDSKIVLLNQVPPSSSSADNPPHGVSGSHGQPFVVPDLKDSEIKTLSKEDILKNKMSVEEIKTLPRFQNYDTGSPSQVLFIKNLPNRTKEADLVSVFGMFDNTEGHRVIYRLMTGKMKGQAFITFPNVEKATEALNVVNGYLLRKKPMIIQFGHTNSSFFKTQVDMKCCENMSSQLQFDSSVLTLEESASGKSSLL